jgi:hypothetical protein
VRTSGPRERGDRVNDKANVPFLPSRFGAMPRGWHRLIMFPLCARTDPGGYVG